MADQELFQFDQREPIRGYPELRREGKRPYTSTQYYPAQCKETHSEAVVLGSGKDASAWMNRLYWDDNLQGDEPFLEKLILSGGCSETEVSEQL